MNSSYSHFSEKASPFCKDFQLRWETLRESRVFGVAGLESCSLLHEETVKKAWNVKTGSKKVGTSGSGGLVGLVKLQGYYSVE